MDSQTHQENVRSPGEHDDCLGWVVEDADQWSLRPKMVWKAVRRETGENLSSSLLVLRLVTLRKSWPVPSTPKSATITEPQAKFKWGLGFNNNIRSMLFDSNRCLIVMWEWVLETFKSKKAFYLQIILQHLRNDDTILKIKYIQENEEVNIV